MENTNEEQTTGNNERFLQFMLGDEAYAVHLLKIREVIPVPETTQLPNSQKHFVGIMNLRGQIISIYDLRQKLGIQSDCDSKEEAVVIVKIADTSVGLVVDSIDRVFQTNDSQIMRVPEIKSQVNAKFISGVFRQDSQLTMILDIGKIFNLDELKQNESMAS